MNQPMNPAQPSFNPGAQPQQPYPGQAPAQQAPMQQAPMQGAPMQQAPMQGAPMPQAPAQQGSAQQPGYGQAPQPYAQPQGYAQPQAPRKGGISVGGIVLLGLAACCMLITLGAGYFSWSNFGAAERLAVGLPDGADFVVRIVEKKAQNQAIVAAVFGFFSMVLGAAGAFLFAKKRKAA